MQPTSDSTNVSSRLNLSSAASKCRVLVGVTGSVAALKLPLLVSELLKIPGVSLQASISLCLKTGLVGCECNCMVLL